MKRFLTILFITVFTLTNAVFVHAAEANFWVQRMSLRGPSGPRQSITADSDERLPRRVAPRNDGVIIPQQFGTIRQISKGASGRTIIHIQDIHQNKEAQENISKAIQHLAAIGQVDLIAVEGLFDDVDLSLLKNFPHKDISKKIDDLLLSKNKISGPLHAALQVDVDVTGVDDKRHYDLNVQAVKEAYAVKEKLKAQNLKLKINLNDQKAKVFNEELLDFDKQVQAYRNEEINLGEYATLLVRHPGESRDPDRSVIPAEAGIQIGLLIEAYNLEKSLDLPRVEHERAIVLKELSKTLSKRENEMLIEQSMAFRSGHVNHAELYRFIQKLCEKKNVSLRHYKSLRDYIQYVLLAESVDGEILQDELRDQEKNIYAQQAKTKEEKELIEKARLNFLTQKLIDFSLTKQEWVEYGGATLPASPLQSFENFYNEATLRDQKMAENLKSAIKKHDAKNIVLVTGGFHSQGIKNNLIGLRTESRVPSPQYAGPTIISFTPKVTKVESEESTKALSVFAQKKSPLDQIFEGEKLFLAHPPITNRVVAEGVTRRVAEGLRQGQLTWTEAARWIYKVRPQNFGWRLYDSKNLKAALRLWILKSPLLLIAGLLIISPMLGFGVLVMTAWTDRDSWFGKDKSEIEWAVDLLKKKFFKKGEFQQRKDEIREKLSGVNESFADHGSIKFHLADFIFDDDPELYKLVELLGEKKLAGYPVDVLWFLLTQGFIEKLAYAHQAWINEDFEERLSHLLAEISFVLHATAALTLIQTGISNGVPKAINGAARLQTLIDNVHLKMGSRVLEVVPSLPELMRLMTSEEVRHTADTFDRFVGKITGPFPLQKMRSKIRESLPPAPVFIETNYLEEQLMQISEAAYSWPNGPREFFILLSTLAQLHHLDSQMLKYLYYNPQQSINEIIRLVRKPNEFDIHFLKSLLPHVLVLAREDHFLWRELIYRVLGFLFYHGTVLNFDDELKAVYQNLPPGEKRDFMERGERFIHARAVTNWGVSEIFEYEFVIQSVLFAWAGQGPLRLYDMLARTDRWIGWSTTYPASKREIQFKGPPHAPVSVQEINEVALAPYRSAQDVVFNKRKVVIQTSDGPLQIEVTPLIEEWVDYMNSGNYKDVLRFLKGVSHGVSDKELEDRLNENAGKLAQNFTWLLHNERHLRNNTFAPVSDPAANALTVIFLEIFNAEGNPHLNFEKNEWAQFITYVLFMMMVGDQKENDSVVNNNFHKILRYRELFLKLEMVLDRETTARDYFEEFIMPLSGAHPSLKMIMANLHKELDTWVHQSTLELQFWALENLTNQFINPVDGGIEFTENFYDLSDIVRIMDPLQKQATPDQATAWDTPLEYIEEKVELFNQVRIVVEAPVHLFEGGELPEIMRFNLELINLLIGKDFKKINLIYSEHILSPLVLWMNSKGGRVSKEKIVELFNDYLSQADPERAKEILTIPDVGKIPLDIHNRLNYLRRLHKVLRPLYRNGNAQVFYSDRSPVPYELSESQKTVYIEFSSLLTYPQTFHQDLRLDPPDDFLNIFQFSGLDNYASSELFRNKAIIASAKKIFSRYIPLGGRTVAFPLSIIQPLKDYFLGQQAEEGNQLGYDLLSGPAIYVHSQARRGNDGDFEFNPDPDPAESVSPQTSPHVPVGAFLILMGLSLFLADQSPMFSFALSLMAVGMVVPTGNENKHIIFKHSLDPLIKILILMGVGWGLVSFTGSNLLSGYGHGVLLYVSLGLVTYIVIKAVRHRQIMERGKNQTPADIYRAIQAAIINGYLPSHVDPSTIRSSTERKNILRSWNASAHSNGITYVRPEYSVLYKTMARLIRRHSYYSSHLARGPTSVIGEWLQFFKIYPPEIYFSLISIMKSVFYRRPHLKSNHKRARNGFSVRQIDDELNKMDMDALAPVINRTSIEKLNAISSARMLKELTSVYKSFRSWPDQPPATELSEHLNRLEELAVRYPLASYRLSGGTETPMRAYRKLADASLTLLLKIRWMLEHDESINETDRKKLIIYAEKFSRIAHYAIEARNVIHNIYAYQRLSGYFLSKDNVFERTKIPHFIRGFFYINAGLRYLKKDIYPSLIHIYELGNTISTGFYPQPQDMANIMMIKIIEPLKNPGSKESPFYGHWTFRAQFGRLLGMVSGALVIAYFLNAILHGENIFDYTSSVKNLFITGVGASAILSWFLGSLGMRDKNYASRMNLIYDFQKFIKKEAEQAGVNVDQSLIDDALQIHQKLIEENFNLEMQLDHPTVDLIIVVSNERRIINLFLDTKWGFRRPETPIISLESNSRGSLSGLTRSFEYLHSKQFVQLRKQRPHLRNRPLEELRIVVIAVDESAIAVALQELNINFRGNPRHRVKSVEWALMSSYSITQNLAKKNRGGVVVVDPTKVYMGSFNQEGDITLIGSRTTLQAMTQANLPILYQGANRRVRRLLRMVRGELVQDFFVNLALDSKYDQTDLDIIQMTAFTGDIVFSFKNKRRLNTFTSLVGNVSRIVNAHPDTLFDLTDDFLAYLVLSSRRHSNPLKYVAARGLDPTKSENIPYWKLAKLFLLKKKDFDPSIYMHVANISQLYKVGLIFIAAGLLLAHMSALMGMCLLGGAFFIQFNSGPRVRVQTSNEAGEVIYRLKSGAEIMGAEDLRELVRKNSNIGKSDLLLAREDYSPEFLTILIEAYNPGNLIDVETRAFLEREVLAFIAHINSGSWAPIVNLDIQADVWKYFITHLLLYEQRFKNFNIAHLYSDQIQFFRRVFDTIVAGMDPSLDNDMFDHFFQMGQGHPSLRISVMNLMSHWQDHRKRGLLILKELEKKKSWKYSSQPNSISVVSEQEVEDAITREERNLAQAIIPRTPHQRNVYRDPALFIAKSSEQHDLVIYEHPHPRFRREGHELSNTLEFQINAFKKFVQAGYKNIIFTHAGLYYGELFNLQLQANNSAPRFQAHNVMENYLNGKGTIIENLGHDPSKITPHMSQLLLFWAEIKRLAQNAQVKIFDIDKMNNKHLPAFDQYFEKIDGTEKTVVFGFIGDVPRNENFKKKPLHILQSTILHSEIFGGFSHILSSFHNALEIVLIRAGWGESYKSVGIEFSGIPERVRVVKELRGLHEDKKLPHLEDHVRLMVFTAEDNHGRKIRKPRRKKPVNSPAPFFPEVSPSGPNPTMPSGIPTNFMPYISASLLVILGLSVLFNFSVAPLFLIVPLLMSFSHRANEIIYELTEDSFDPEKQNKFIGELNKGPKIGKDQFIFEREDLRDLFGWALHNTFSPNVSLTPPSRQLLANEVLAFIAYFNSGVNEKYNDVNLQAKVWTHFLFRLIRQASLLSNILSTAESKFAQQSFNETATSVILAGLDKSVREDVVNKLIDLARLEPAVASQVSRLVTEWDQRVQDGQILINALSAYKSLRYYQVDSDKVQSEAVAQHVHAEFVSELARHLQPNLNSETFAVFQNPISYFLRKTQEFDHIEFHHPVPFYNPKSSRLSRSLQFQIYWLNEILKKKNIKNIVFTHAGSYVTDMMEAKTDDIPPGEIKKRIAMVEHYLAHGGNIREALGFGSEGYLIPSEQQRILFFEALREFVLMHDGLRISLFDVDYGEYEHQMRLGDKLKRLPNEGRSIVFQWVGSEQKKPQTQPKYKIFQLNGLHAPRDPYQKMFLMIYDSALSVMSNYGALPGKYDAGFLIAGQPYVTHIIERFRLFLKIPHSFPIEREIDMLVATQEQDGGLEELEPDEILPEWVPSPDFEPVFMGLIIIHSSLFYNAHSLIFLLSVWVLFYWIFSTGWKKDIWAHRAILGIQDKTETIHDILGPVQTLGVGDFYVSQIIEQKKIGLVLTSQNKELIKAAIKRVSQSENPRGILIFADKTSFFDGGKEIEVRFEEGLVSDGHVNFNVFDAAVGRLSKREQKELVMVLPTEILSQLAQFNPGPLSPLRLVPYIRLEDFISALVNVSVMNIDHLLKAFRQTLTNA